MQKQKNENVDSKNVKSNSLKNSVTFSKRQKKNKTRYGFTNVFIIQKEKSHVIKADSPPFSIGERENRKTYKE